MSILTGPAIVAAVRDGAIEVDPWDEIAKLVEAKFPRTHALYAEGRS